MWCSDLFFPVSLLPILCVFFLCPIHYVILNLAALDLRSEGEIVAAGRGRRRKAGNLTTRLLRDDSSSMHVLRTVSKRIERPNEMRPHR